MQVLGPIPISASVKNLISIDWMIFFCSDLSNESNKVVTKIAIRGRIFYRSTMTLNCQLVLEISIIISHIKHLF